MRMQISRNLLAKQSLEEMQELVYLSKKREGKPGDYQS
jgi:hypothetical protein